MSTHSILTQLVTHHNTLAREGKLNPTSGGDHNKIIPLGKLMRNTNYVAMLTMVSKQFQTISIQRIALQIK